MRIEALHTGIKLQIFAIVGARLFNQPIEKFAAETKRSVGSLRNKIVHVKKLAGKERFEKSVAGDGAHFAFRLEKRQQVAFLLLTRDALDKFLRIFEVRSQLAHDRVTAANFIRRCGDGDTRIYHADLAAGRVRPTGGLVSRLPLYHRSSRSRDRAARVPRMMIASDRVKIVPGEYIRNLRPEVTIASRKILKRPSLFSARLKKISSPMKNCSSKPPIASKFLRLVKRKAPAPRLLAK